MAGLDTELEAALKAMEASFHVRLISTFAPELICAPAEADATTWLKTNNQEFDQFPVKHNDVTVGILLRNGSYKGKKVRDAMQPLGEGLIVSADMPIADLIPQLRENHCRLVLRGGRIDGLVTQSDLLKLPVRMLVFALISHLELLMRSLIRNRYPNNEWINNLTPRSKQRIERDIRRLQTARLEPDALEFTYFSDALQVLANEPDLQSSLNAITDDVTQLRNQIAHAKTFITSPKDVKVFVDRFEKLRGLIKQLPTV